MKRALATYTATFTLSQYERLKAAGLPQRSDAAAWLVKRVEHAATMDKGAGRLGDLLEALDAPEGVDVVEWAGMLRELVRAQDAFSLAFGGSDRIIGAWNSIDDARKPPRPVPPTPPPKRLDSWTMTAPRRGHWSAAEVEVMRESTPASLPPSVFLIVEERGEDATAILTPPQAREVAAQLVRFAENAEAAEVTPRPVPTEPGEYWGSWKGGPVRAVAVDEDLVAGFLCKPVDDDRWTWQADPDDRSKPWRAVFPGVPDGR